VQGLSHEESARVDVHRMLAADAHGVETVIALAHGEYAQPLGGKDHHR
jgi:hypothetical protein